MYLPGDGKARKQNSLQRTDTERGTMALALRLLLLLLLAVALPARTAQAAPWRVQGADQGAGVAFPAAGMEDALEEPFGAFADQGAGLASPAAGMGDALEEESFGAYAKMEQKALLKSTLSAGSSGSIPAPGTQSEEVPDSATEDVLSEPEINTEDPVRLPRIVCPQDVRRSCMIGTVVTLFSVPLVLACCYFGIRKLYQMRRRRLPMDDPPVSGLVHTSSTHELRDHPCTPILEEPSPWVNLARFYGMGAK
ncbi:hypothetical protein DUI87_23375 [Hirundo rustica rustica]|uniref:Uncharacterized protein n=1 Tax=Hirundo rustica rustica TaxID=333673 RepID=A0A3M0JYE6_HIRRU|nr:hypothetical protein DUI87_23375 [Hirundo rustica rustica]